MKMCSDRWGLIVSLAVGSARAVEVDTDRDGLSDGFEQALLERLKGAFGAIAPAEKR
jgi:hypothetical protein